MGHALRQICLQAYFVTSRDFDLTDIQQTESLFQTIKPTQVIHLAAKVAGVKSNALRNADLLAANSQINTNVLSAAQKSGVERLISVLSSCSYAVYSDRPSTESDLHVGLPFKGNLGYGYSKRMLDIQTKLLWEQYGCEYSTITPVTMYGPNDNWDLEEGHVLGSLIHKCFLAKQNGNPLEVWGSGNAVRQFVYSLDIAKILLRMLESDYKGPETTVIAADDGIAIKDLVLSIARAMDFHGEIIFDRTKPEGQLVRVMESKRFADFFQDFQFTPLEEGVRRTVDWFRNQESIVVGSKKGF